VSAAACLHRNVAHWESNKIFLELLTAKLFVDCFSVIGIYTVHMETVLGQVDAHYLHFLIFAMFSHGSLRFIWLTGITSLAH
jgi:hypothetical protein